MINRFLFPPVCALTITLLLFYLMQFLIAVDEVVLGPDTPFTIVPIVRVIEETILKTKSEVIKKPPPPVTPPLIPKAHLPGPAVTGLGDGRLRNPVMPSGEVEFAQADGPYLPVVKVQPRYPSRAASRGLTGWAVVEFTVTINGSVADAYIVESCAWIQSRFQGQCFDSPNEVFDREAIRAVQKFKYKPKISQGEAVPSYGVQNRIVFELSDG